MLPMIPTGPPIVTNMYTVREHDSRKVASRINFRMINLCKTLSDCGVDNPGTAVRAKNLCIMYAIPIIIGFSMVWCWT